MQECNNSVKCRHCGHTHPIELFVIDEGRVGYRFPEGVCDDYRLAVLNDIAHQLVKWGDVDFVMH